MAISLTTTRPEDISLDETRRAEPTPAKSLEVTLLTGGFDKPYAFGLTKALLKKETSLDVVGSDDVDDPEFHGDPRLRFLNLFGPQPLNSSFSNKLVRVARYYARLIAYALRSRPKIFHILWNNKFPVFDRTALLLFYKALGKKIVFTAHNVNAGKRDSNDSRLNRWSLRSQYRLSDHIFVHTEQMKRELLEDFHIADKKATVIPFGINNLAPQTDSTKTECRNRLGLQRHEKAILFFGNIGPYKGLELLVEAFQTIAGNDASYRLIIAGKPRGGSEGYLDEVLHTIRQHPSCDRVMQKIEFVPDEETELYFKAADVLVLPYKHIFQSGVLFLGYSFGLPVIATDVGSLKEDIVIGKTGFVCKPNDAVDLARVIETYFKSELFRHLDGYRTQIQDFARTKYSWDVVSEKTCEVYARLLGRTQS